MEKVRRNCYKGNMRNGERERDHEKKPFKNYEKERKIKG